MRLLNIYLFGSPQISVDGAPIKIPTARAIPLLAYLAITGKGQSRDVLANLLWSEVSTKQALAALRTTLWRIKSAGLEDWINFDHDEISWNDRNPVKIDVVDFQAGLNKCTTHGHPVSQICIHCIPCLSDAVGLYRGDFMSGFNLSKAPVFDDWRFQQSEALHLRYLEAIERLVKGHRTMGEFSQAIQYANLWLRQDHYNEDAQYQLLQLYAITGQRAAAITSYKHYKELLGREIGIEPSAEITDLHKHILTGHTTPPAVQYSKSPIFLMADIENAALFWNTTGTRKSEYVHAYNNTFMEISKRFGGHILQIADDNVTMLFENGQPVHFAVTIYLRIKQMDWGEAGTPKIRMVLYTTTPDDKNISSFSSITRAATSLLSSSWGGQITFSEQTYRLLNLPSGASVRDLGFHSLKDVDGSVHIYELLHPHLPPASHQPLQSGSPQLINFPTLSPAFIGRETELSELTRLIEAPENRILALVGPGGVGKTRLAVKLANQISAQFPDGVFFISLAPIQDPELLPIVVADTLKFSFYGPQNQSEQLANYLHRMKVLLVFDNIEHLRHEGAQFLAFLHAQTFYPKFLITTRERLNMISEISVDIHGLQVPPEGATQNLESYSSIRLFLHNAQRISPHFILGEYAEAISRICRYLDGIPLSIILASSWVRVYSPAQIVDEIKTSLDFLSTAAPDIPSRHQSLRAVFDHSWQLLSEKEQKILCRLSIFSAAFSATAAIEICDATLVILASFMDKSLLRKRMDERYEMLETFHQYATQKLLENKEEYYLTRTKFCDFYVDFCSEKLMQFFSSSQRAALDDMTADLENIRACWNWSVESDQWETIEKTKTAIINYHIMIGNLVQGREFFSHAAQKLDKSSDPALKLIRASIKQYEAYLKARIGFINEGLVGLNESLEVFRQADSHWDLAVSYLFLAETSRTVSNIHQAKKYIETALQYFSAEDLPRINYTLGLIAHCRSILGSLFIDLGELATAHTYLQSSLATHKSIGTLYGMIYPLLGLARLAYIQGEFIQARDLYLQALEVASNLYDQRGLAVIHNNIASVYEAMSNIPESYHHVLTALRFCTETGDRRLKAVILNNLAYHEIRFLKHGSEAIRTYHESIEIFNALSDLRGLAYTYYDLCRAYLQVGLSGDAWDYCSRALHTAMTLDSVPLILHSLHGFVSIFIDTQQAQRALQMCYFLLDNPQIEPDTKKRVIVSKVGLEANLTLEVIHNARVRSKSSSLQELIDQIQAENYR